MLAIVEWYVAGGSSCSVRWLDLRIVLWLKFVLITKTFDETFECPAYSVDCVLRCDSHTESEITEKAGQGASGTVFKIK